MEFATSLYFPFVLHIWVM